MVKCDISEIFVMLFLNCRKRTYCDTAKLLMVKKGLGMKLQTAIHVTLECVCMNVPIDLMISF